MDTLSLKIEGMTCGHCVAAVRGALERLEGVRVEDVTIGSAKVAYDPARASTDDILDAVNDEGYTAHREG